jgi:hypothetical protein
MLISSKGDIRININNTMVNQVERFIYFGNEITSEKKTDWEINRRNKNSKL